MGEYNTEQDPEPGAIDFPRCPIDETPLVPNSVEEGYRCTDTREHACRVFFDAGPVNTVRQVNAKFGGADWIEIGVGGASSVFFIEAAFLVTTEGFPPVEEDIIMEEEAFLETTP